MSLLPGRAGPEGTRRLAEGHAAMHEHDGYRDASGLRLSTVGIGTYLGEADPETDRGYRDAVARALAGGMNVVDTAINYRHQRSERVVGEALRQAVDEGTVGRDGVFVSTKGGYLAYDADVEDPQADMQARYIDTGILTPDNLVANVHCMDPQYLETQVAASRHNLGLETIDLYYVHNPETQFAAVDADTFHGRLRAAFAGLEQAVDAGHIARYGIATWDGLRRPPDHQAHLSLARVLDDARAAAAEAGHEDHHFAAVQAPLNLAMDEAARRPTQVVEEDTVPLAEACRRLGLAFITSASILQGRLARGLPPEIKEKVGDVGSDAMRALQATRSAPGVTTALVGMSSSAHVDDALGLMRDHRPDAGDVWR